MVNLEDVENEIIQLESKDTSYAVIERLSWLYICRDHLRGVPQNDIKSLERYGSSPFLIAVADCPSSGLFSILDEHMNCIREIYPKEYNVIVQKITALKAN